MGTIVVISKIKDFGFKSKDICELLGKKNRKNVFRKLGNFIHLTNVYTSFHTSCSAFL